MPTSGSLSITPCWTKEPHHVLKVSLLFFVYLVLHFALFPQYFEPHLTWWCGKKVTLYALRGNTNLRCSKLGFPARILFGPGAPTMSSRDTGNCSKHSKVNVSYLDFLKNHKMLKLEGISEMMLSILGIIDEKMEAQRGVWNSTPIQVFQDLGMSILRSCNDSITSVGKDLGLSGLI